MAGKVPARRTSRTPRSSTPSAPSAAEETPPEPEAPEAPRARQARERMPEVAMVEGMPRVGTSARAGPAPTKAPPQAPYWLVHHPDRWEVYGGERGRKARVLPALSKAKLIAGCGGVGRTRGGMPDPDLMLVQLEQRGEIRIPWDVDGEGTSYMRQDRATRGWYSRWERVYPGSSRVLEGGETYEDWLESLITRGVIAPCPVAVLHDLLGRYQALVVDAAADDVQRAIYEARVRAVEAELEQAEAELDVAGSPLDEPV